MIEQNDLIEGAYYFLISFFEGGPSVPEIETYIFVGKNVLPSDKESKDDYWYFQDPESFFEKGNFLSISEKSEREVLRLNGETLQLVYNLDGIINELSQLK